VKTDAVLRACDWVNGGQEAGKQFSRSVSQSVGQASTVPSIRTREQLDGLAH
jgi:hypothetical protein